MKVYIYGCSGFGLELEGLLRDSELVLNNEVIRNVSFAGFLGDKQYIAKEYLHLCVGDITRLHSSDGILLAIGNNVVLRAELATMLRDKVLCPNMFHKSSFIYTKDIGIGNIVALFCNISPLCKVGDFNFFNSRSGMGHNASMGSYNTISAYSDLLGYAKIGDKNTLGDSSHLLPRAQIGNNNTVAPGSIIYKRFRDNNLISGNPAQKIDKLDSIKT
ncbi:hypothetical protein LS71_005305 [Helicobacter jaachi]|uniref:Acetyltransferase n=1 Tax=Helicobacter jaachi TaxID=1677920 RepID=A0A4U8TBB8_9HELI|nr:hypothetical protein [Helicobacter jaachi]TLD96488.1 hypothetical protein LS71_005305 [Helicobacter jaachi]